MRKVYSTLDLVTLYLLNSKLADHGIQSLIKNEQPPLAGEIPSTTAWPELWVLEDKQYKQAAKIIRDELNALMAFKEVWRCPQCQEYLEGQFNICWQCGYSRKPD